MGNPGDRQATATLFDLARYSLAVPPAILSTFNAAMPPDLAVSCLAHDGHPVGIWFDVFSDGRGFTLARRLRESACHDGLLVAFGHLIPDQADYLRRCGFTHVCIAAQSADQWRRSLILAPPAMQHVLHTGRARAGHGQAPGRINPVT